MALEWLLVKDAVQETSDSYSITDETVYGGANPARAERANVLFVTKTTSSGTRTLQAVTPNTSDPVTVSQWDVATAIDGWNEKILASVNVHVADQAYAAADIILYSGGFFYKTLQVVPGGTNPAGVTDAYYEIITDDSLYSDYLENTSIEWVMQDELVTGKTEEKIIEYFDDFSDKFLSGKCDFGGNTEADFLSSLLESAEAAFTNGRPSDAEAIIRGMDNYYKNAA